MNGNLQGLRRAHVSDRRGPLARVPETAPSTRAYRLVARRARLTTGR